MDCGVGPGSGGSGAGFRCGEHQDAGDVEADGQLISNTTTLAPLQVLSSVLVTGFNADLVDGLDSNDFAAAVHNHDTQYFTETELSTSGLGAAVHWNNLTNVPQPRADGPCFDDANRYVDCLNGTVTDTVTGLTWLQDASCLGFATYAGANQRAAQLGADTADGATCGLTDNSNPGDWRLPTRAEWDATIARAAGVTLGCTSGGAGVPPSLTDIEGTGCFEGGSGNQPFSGVQNSYWSSSAGEAVPGNAWDVFFNFGLTFNDFKGFVTFVWPVRGGQ